MRTPRLPLLLVEDNPAHATLVQCCLEDQPAAVYHAHDGEEALAYLRHEGRFTNAKDHPRPRVIILDLNLPKIDGFDVLRQVKASASLSSIPVVILTTSDSTDDIQRAYALGADSYVVKPTELNAFTRAMEIVCETWLDKGKAA